MNISSFVNNCYEKTGFAYGVVLPLAVQGGSYLIRLGGKALREKSAACAPMQSWRKKTLDLAGKVMLAVGTIFGLAALASVAALHCIVFGAQLSKWVGPVGAPIGFGIGLVGGVILFTEGSADIIREIFADSLLSLALPR